ncbi:dihydropteroate synthase [Acuticoccus sp. I52.16.1]|uniref:dihydropteroate synthase n=1 Tax=Acuticoccus sp. I52.16.1 TaxID=2928472 RepID=UPI001FD5B996|nr:dihydropteroate synthase [Acuticoccus sp. I52.16.1]UOM34438.1 dihydropteroate synthase [Acuticoccus sp. I52.16.1]
MTRIVGIVNVTPDSFANAQPSLAPDAAITEAADQLEDGADVIDVGAESTRPGGSAVTPEEEWDRLAPCLPEIVRLAHARGAKVSVDTRNPATAERAIGAGVDWINDVCGGGPEMAAVVAGSDVALVIMHALSVPVVSGETLPAGTDMIAHVDAWFAARLDRLAAAGVDPARVILDPGIGFGTTPRHAFDVLARLPLLHALGRPLLVGHSRKSFMATVTDVPACERDDVTLALSGVLMLQGADYIRVHNVARHAALRARLRADAG